MNCFMVYDSKLKACPGCGHENEIEENELKNIDAELTDIKPFKVDYTLKRFSKDVKSIKRLRNIRRLLLVC